jgi:peptidoglycan/LPS O-acetylase OafA/YrhL
MVSSGRQRNYHLDVIRVLAAFSVLFTHLRSMFFEPYRQAGGSLLVRLIYIEHYLARGGVMCFFVLSGYLVGNSVLNSIEKGSWSWPEYLVRRVTRLEIVLIPALLITALLDFFGPRISPIYGEVHGAYTWTNFFGCAVFLQQVIKSVLPFGSNGPLWSLSYEFWYYILFPLVALILIRRKNLLMLVPLAAAVVWLTYGTVLFLFSCWLGGIAAGYLAKKYPMNSAFVRRAAIAISVLGILGVTLACGAHKLPVTPADYIFGVFTVLLVWACLCVPLRSSSSPYARGVILLSEFSYTLYLTHAPFLQFLKAVWLGTATWKADYAHVLLAVVPFLAAIAFAYGCYLLFESNTDRVRRYIHSKLNLPERSAKVRSAEAMAAAD